MAVIIQLRHDTASNWTTNNPILAVGEAGIETDTNRIKIGNGVARWNSLAYFGGSVQSVNGQTGAVVLDASDVGALPDNTFIPTKTSDLTNDSDFATVSQIPTNNNQLTNGAGYITSSALSGYATESFVTSQGYITNSALSGYATEQWVTNQGYTTNTGTVTSVNNTEPVNGNVTLSIPSEVTETTVTNWGFTKNVGTVTSVNNTQPVDGNVTITIPTVPTNVSDFTNDAGYITSSALTDYQQKTTITAITSGDSITLADNTIFNGSELSSLTIALPASATVAFISELVFSSGSTPTTLTYPNTIKWLDGSDDVSSNVFTPVASKRYTVVFYYDGTNYIAVVKGV